MNIFDPIFLYKLGRKFRKIKFIANFFFRLNKILNSCHLHPECDIGEGTILMHDGIGVVINRKAKIGKNVKIYQNVTIGNKALGQAEYPIIEDDVIIYANSVVVGNITIGKGAIIGACSFVNKSVPPYEIWAGVPARKIGEVKKKCVEYSEQ